jgi:DNA adenine methylase
VLRLKRPALSSIAIERDGDALVAWRDPKLPDLRIICGDAISWLAKFRAKGDEFIYCDPPYLLSTRSGGGIYRHELSDAEHVRLLSILKRLRCSIAISGYWSPMYARALSDWRATQFITRKRNHAKSEEWLWMNYPEPMALQDYRYLGKNFRERERIKRKKNRWKARLSKMPLLERQVLVATLAEVDDGRSCNGKKGEVGRKNCPNCNYAMSSLPFRNPTRLWFSRRCGHRHFGRAAPAEIA